MEMRLKRMKKSQELCTDFANILKQKLDERKRSVLKHPTMLCAIYLDPRLQEELNDNEIGIAKMTLANLHERIIELQAKNSPGAGVDDEEKQNTSLEEYFAQKRQQQAQDNSTSERSEFMQLLDSFRLTLQAADTRTVHENSILHFWEMRKSTNKKLYDVARVICAIPPSQATVERSFSTLSFVFNEKRSKLAQQTLENILLIKLNNDIAKSVNANDMEQLTISQASEPVATNSLHSMQKTTKKLSTIQSNRFRYASSKYEISFFTFTDSNAAGSSLTAKSKVPCQPKTTSEHVTKSSRSTNTKK